jgi:hypothetical protein
VLSFTPADATRINIKSVNEVNYWCYSFNCTETRLLNAVIAVGLSPPVYRFISLVKIAWMCSLKKPLPGGCF